MTPILYFECGPGLCFALHTRQRHSNSTRIIGAPVNTVAVQICGSCGRTRGFRKIPELFNKTFFITQELALSSSKQFTPSTPSFFRFGSIAGMIFVDSGQLRQRIYLDVLNRPKSRSFNVNSCFGNRRMTAGARSGESGSCERNVVSRISSEEYAGAFSWWRIHFFFLHESGLFLLTPSQQFNNFSVVLFVDSLATRYKFMVIHLHNQKSNITFTCD